LSEFTDQYNIEYIVTGLSGNLRNESIRFEIDSEYNRVFHFFEWKFTSIWDMIENYPIAYSEVSGIMTPQSMEAKNKNITTAFKGPMTTHIYLDLTPTSYVSEPDSYSYTGY